MTQAPAPSAPANRRNISNSALKSRRIIYCSIIGVSVAALLVGAAIVAVKKSKKLDIVLPRFTFNPPQARDVACGCAMVCLGLSCMGLNWVPAVPKFIVWSGAVCGVFAGVYFLLLRRASLTWASIALVESSGYAELRTSQPQEGQEVSAQDTSSRLQRREQYRQRLKAVFQKYSRRRQCISVCLLLVYIGACCGLPVLFQSHVSCQNGFLWEDHIPFLVTFVVTKVVELLLYLYDPTLDGQLSLWKFMLVFVPSLFSFADGYQDSTSIQIATACGKHDAPCSNPALSRTLSWTME